MATPELLTHAVLTPGEQIINLYEQIWATDRARENHGPAMKISNYLASIVTEQELRSDNIEYLDPAIAGEIGRTTLSNYFEQITAKDDRSSALMKKMDLERSLIDLMYELRGSRALVRAINPGTKPIFLLTDGDSMNPKGKHYESVTGIITSRSYFSPRPQSLELKRLPVGIIKRRSTYDVQMKREGISTTSQVEIIIE